MRRGLLCSLAIMLLAVTNAFAQNAADPADPNAAASTAEAAAEQEPKSIYDDPALKPRDIYNLAIQKLGANEFDSAIEGLGRARDLAAFDNELRYSAAYNLGFAFAARAASAGDMNALQMDALQGVINDLDMSIAWFRDAARQRPSLKEAKGNLEIVLKRELMAKDIMAQKYNTLEHQLDALIQTERGLRESSRALSERIQASNAGRDPLAFQDEFKALAKLQRQAVTDSNQTAENLAHAISSIESKPEAERTQEEAFKLFQLQSASPMLDSARQSMSGARRQLRELSMNEALRLTNKAFQALKQAREQLDDPLKVLGHILEDQTNFVRIASAKHMFETPDLLAKYKAQMQRDDIETPPWLTSELLNDEQTDTMTRTTRVSAFLKAMVQAAEQQPQNAQQDPKQAEAAKEQIEQIKEALPLIDEAADAMQRATQAIERSDFQDSVKQGSEANQKLSLAMERFADLKHLIELAYASQENMDPVIRGELEGNESLLSRSQQRQILKPMLETNIDRLARLSNLLAKESAKMNQQAMQGAQNGQQVSEEQQQQMQQLFETAENLRKQALDAENRLLQKVTEPTPEGAENIDETAVPSSLNDATWGDLAGDAETAKQSLEQLRILFFTVVEHIQELLKQQSATLDKTTDVSTADASELDIKLPPVIDRERMHELTAEKLSEVLTKQAESLQNQPQQQGGQNPADMAKRYTEAASELQVAATAMRQAQSDLQNEERLFTESIEQQNTAIEHIQKALEILQPPQQQQQQQQQQNQDQQNQDQQQQQQQQKQQQQKMSKEQADKKIQQIRSRDQERRKSKERSEGSMPVVEKDW